MAGDDAAADHSVSAALAGLARQEYATMPAAGWRRKITSRSPSRPAAWNCWPNPPSPKRRRRLAGGIWSLIDAAQASRAAAAREDAHTAAEALRQLAEAQCRSQSARRRQASRCRRRQGQSAVADAADGQRSRRCQDCPHHRERRTAKNQAYVLSELGRVVSNSRSGERWSRLSEDFTAASLAAARSPRRCG